MEKRSRLKIKVPIFVAFNVAQRGMGCHGPEAKEVLPNVRVVSLKTYYLHSGLTGGGNYHTVDLVVQWGDRFFKNEDSYCQFSGNEFGYKDPNTHLSITYEKSHLVPFIEVFPEINETTSFM